MYSQANSIMYLTREANYVPHKRSQIYTSQEKPIMYFKREANYVPHERS